MANNVIRKVNLSTGIITTFAGTGVAGYSGDGGFATAAQLNLCSSVAFDLAGNVYITDFNNQVIRKVDNVGIITTYAGTGSCGYSGDGGPALAAKLCAPLGMQNDVSGNLFISDIGNTVVRKIDISTGIISTVAGNGTTGYSGDGGPATSAQLNANFDISVDNNGNLFIADFNNNVIRKVNTSGIISTYAGNGTGGFSGDGGPAASAQLLNPMGVKADVSGNLYIADWSNNRVRKVSVQAINGGIDCSNASFLFTGNRMLGNLPINFSTQVVSSWYSFSAEGVSEIVKAVNITPVSKIHKMIIYSGTCSALTQIGSDSLPTPLSHSMQVNLSSLTPGNLYYMQVLKNNSSNSLAKFSIGVSGTSTVTCVPIALSVCTPTVPSNPCEMVLNGDFRQHTVAPNRNGELEDACGWINPSSGSTGTNQATPDYFFANGSGGYSSSTCKFAADEPCNSVTYDYGHTTPGVANGYGGIIPYTTGATGGSGNVYCEYMGSKMRTAMTAGVNYTVTMWVKNADYHSNQCNNIGILFTSIPLVQSGYAQITSVSAHVNTSIISTSGLWTQIGFAHPASGSENYFYIGDFSASTPTFSAGVCYIPGYNSVSHSCPGTAPAECQCNADNGLGCDPFFETYPYYIFDDISITPVSAPLNISAASNPGCSPDVLTAIGGFGTGSTYNWSNSTIGITTSVNTSGTYTVTNSAAGLPACKLTASISVTISPSPSLTVNSATICSGNSATLTAAGGASTFSWTPSIGLSSTTGTSVIANPSITTVYTVTGANSSGCTNVATATVTVRPTPTPTAVVTGLNPICSGQSTTLHVAGGGLGTVIWTPSASLNNASIHSPTSSPTVTTTYTVTATNTFSCTASSMITVIVIPTPTVTIVSSPDPPVICNTVPGSSVTLSASGGTTYTWSANAGGSNATTVTVSPSSNTFYTVSSANGSCIGTAVITVSVQCTCTKGWVLPVSTVTLTSVSQLAPAAQAVHSINHNIFIGGGSTFTLSNYVLFFAPNISMTVLAGTTLIINHCHLLACSDMWQGIIVQPGANLIVQNNSMIEDAYIATNCSNWNASGNTLTIDGCVFNRNQKAINLDNFPFGVAFPATIRNAVFTCRILPSAFTPITWNSTATPAALKALVSVPTPLQSPYAIDNPSSSPTYPLATMKAPLNTLASYFGIYLNNIGLSSKNGLTPTAIGSATILYSDVNIGDPANTSYLNLFDATYYGVFAQTSNFTCQNNAFSNMQKTVIPPCFFCPPNVLSGSGTGIYAGNNNIGTNYYTRAQIIFPGFFPSLNPHIITSGMPAFNNKFYNCVRGAAIFGYTETDLAGADLRSTQSTTNPSSTIGNYGFYVSSSIYQKNYIQFNKITNIHNPIIFQAAASSSAQNTGSVNVDFNWITAHFGNTPGTRYVNNSIILDDIVNCYAPGGNTCASFGLGLVSANDNTIQDVYRGIEMANWDQQRGIEANRNYVGLIQDPANGLQFGINANGNNDHFIKNNNIQGVSTSNLAMHGILCKDNSTSIVQCNLTNSVGRGFKFEGISLGFYAGADPANWSGNTMSNNGRGFELSNCVIGSQGNNTAPMDNFWQGSNWSLGTLDQTYNDNSFLYSSVLTARNIVGYLPTVNNSTGVGNQYNGLNFNNTLLSATSPGTLTACPALPQPPCAICPRPALKIAEQAVQDSIAYPILPAQNAYRAQLSIFKTTQTDSTATDSSVILQNFNTVNQTSNIGKITNVESNLAQGNITAAQSINSSISPTNTIEGNYKKFFTAYINFVNNALTVSDSANLYGLATSCPAVHGSVVYQARSLYNAIGKSYQYFEDNCNYNSFPPSARLAKSAIKSLPENKNNKIYVYPNPNSGEMYISGSNITDTEWNVEVKDLTGRLLFKQTLPIDKGMARLKADLPNGAYFVTVKGSYGNPITQKIIVNN